MEFKLQELPYSKDALMPFLSVETIEFHYGKHHTTYVNNLNKLVQNSEFANNSLKEIIKKSSGAIFNNAAQIWNHTFYWNSILPQNALPKHEISREPKGSLANSINKKWGTLESFKKDFTQTAVGTFGSGWTWLVKNANTSAELEIMSTFNAGCPLTENKIPLFVCDVWEHAYYIDYRNDRLKYVNTFLNIINWDFAEQNYAL